MLAQEPWDDPGTRGVIVNLTSGTVFVDPPAPVGEGRWGLAYVAGKAACSKMVGILHAEFRSQGIRAYNVDPGHIVTENMRALSGRAGDRPEGITNTSPEIPGAVVGWLASDDDDAVAARRSAGQGAPRVQGTGARTRLAVTDILSRPHHAPTTAALSLPIGQCSCPSLAYLLERTF